MNIYLIFLAILLLLSVIDLIVGVSNDAVNFLNSAIGSKVASFKTILIIASLGVFAGSTFSEGVMEVARNGIFNPAFFTFDKVMIIFMAVILTDVILLDVYNTLALPTSTTVSLIFELLGASVAVGLFIIAEKHENFGVIEQYINATSAITIIAGIFLSVLLAFVVGSIVQFISRLMFSFRLKKTVTKYGSFFSGLAIAAIVYFLLIKGAKGSSFIREDQIKWILGHTGMIILGSFLFFTLLVQVLMWWKKVNPLKIVVLLGTFSLAMAFAGNDLVNFIGVAVAGLISFKAWAASLVAPHDFTMQILSAKTITPTWILLIAASVMIVTLWTNAKSRKVTETEVSLGRQGEGDEKFSANNFSRSVVGSMIFVGNGITRLIPRAWITWIDSRFKKRKKQSKDRDGEPSFDLVRASVNLLVSSALIAYGTSQKLPLSTTFVTFMVAMGTSFADKAWGRDSAVYRVAGVFNVIGGWLLTAAIAFTTSAVFALIIYYTGAVGIIVLFVIAGYFLFVSHRLFTKKAKEQKSLEREFSLDEPTIHAFLTQIRKNTSKNIQAVFEVFESVHDMLSGQKVKYKNADKEIRKLLQQNEKFSQKIIHHTRSLHKDHVSAARFNILLFDYIQDLFQSTNFIHDISVSHIRNHHPVPSGRFRDTLNTLNQSLKLFVELTVKSIRTADFSEFVLITDKKEHLLVFLSNSLDEQVLHMQEDKLGNRLGQLQIKLLLEMRDIVCALSDIATLHRDFSKLRASNETVFEKRSLVSI